MAESSIGNYYIQITYKSFQAVVFITDQKTWKMIECSPDSEWPRETAWRTGNWSKDGDRTRCWAYGNNADTEVFHLNEISFPPDLTLTDKVYRKMFFVGDDWAARKHIQLGLHRVGDTKTITIDTRGNWAPFVSGPVMAAVQRMMRDTKEEMDKLLLQAELDVAAMVDPTGALSVPAAWVASRNGDYLGCCLNLLGCIPLIGKLSSAATWAKVSADVAKLAEKLGVLEKWLKLTTDTGKRCRQAARLPEALKVDIQGTTRATSVIKGAVGVKVVAAVAKARQGFKNANWIQKIATVAGAGAKTAKDLGYLESEIAVLRQLAREGYYFVVRSCPKVRVEWLNAAAQRGWGIIAKPVWMKIKSLKGVKFEGLVGFKKGEVEYWQTIHNMRPVSPDKLPHDFDLPWLAFKGVNRSQVRVYDLTKDFNVHKVEDPAFMLDHFFVDTGDAFIIVDKTGRPYLSDIDIAIIQKGTSSGKMAEPGVGVGPTPILKKIVSDDAQFSAHWNAEFAKTVHYPPGYKPFGWHGGRTGTAGFLHPENPKWLGWYPEKPEEDLIIALKGIENLGDDVGFCSSWKTLGEFQKANEKMLGKWLFDKPEGWTPPKH